MSSNSRVIITNTTIYIHPLHPRLPCGHPRPSTIHYRPVRLSRTSTTPTITPQYPMSYQQPCRWVSNPPCHTRDRPGVTHNYMKHQQIQVLQESTIDNSDFTHTHTHKYAHPPTHTQSHTYDNVVKIGTVSNVLPAFIPLQ